MSRCLVICINLVKIYYVHARARYILLSLITCVRRTQPLFSATILRPGHVRGVVAHFSNFPWIGGTLVPGPGALSRLLPYHHRDDNTPGVPGIRDGASGIPPKVINFKIL